MLPSSIFSCKLVKHLGFVALPIWAATIHAQLPTIEKIANFQSNTFWVLSDGSLWASGDNGGGIHGDQTTDAKPFAEQVLNSNVIDVAVGSGHSLVLKSDGSLWGAGHNYNGQLGLGEIESVTNFVEIVPSGVVAIAAAWDRSYFIKDDGSLWGMGSIRAGLNVNRFYKPVRVLEDSVVDVAPGWRHTLILLEDGSLWGTGENFCGKLGVTTEEHFDAPTLIVESDVVGIAAGEEHSVILRNDGTAWTTGVCGSVDEIVTTETKSVFAGPNNAIVIKNDGSVWDTNGPDELNLVWEGDAAQVVSNFDGSRFSSSVILNTNGEAFGLGYNSPEMFGGLYEGETFETPIAIAIPPHPVARAGSDILLTDGDDSGSEAAFLDGTRSYIIKSPPATWLWEWPGGSSAAPAVSTDFPIGETTVSLTVTDGYGRSSSDTLIVTLEAPKAPAPIEPLTIVKAVSGANNVFVLLDDGSLWGKGSNFRGALGDGTYHSTSHWQKLATSNIKDVALYTHSLKLLDGGAVQGSGGNESGQLGTNSVTNTSSDIPILPSGVSKVAAYSGTSLLLLEDGSVLTMGDNPGNGSAGALFEPTLLYDANVIDIGLALNKIYAIKTDGSAWGSGVNNYGALGNFSNTELPVQIFSSGITSITGGAEHSLFLRDDGAVLGLGRSRHGQLGFRSNSINLEPVEIYPDGIVAIEARATSSFVIKTDGSLWASGRDGQGGLGLGPTGGRSADKFTKVFDSSVVSVSAGRPTIVLMDDGSLWGMGSNFGGTISPKLSDLPNTNIYYPTLMVGPTGQCTAFAGRDTLIRDTDQDGQELVVLDAFGSSAPWNIVSAEWSWSGGSAEGMKSMASFNLGTTHVTLRTTAVDGSESLDTIKIFVLPSGETSDPYNQWLLSFYNQNEIDSWTDGIFFADPDLDKISNLDEWVLNFDPADPSSGIDIHFLPDMENNIIELQPASENYNYRLWSSHDLKNWVEISPESSEIVDDTFKARIADSHGPYIRASLESANTEP